MSTSTGLILVASLPSPLALAQTDVGGLSAVAVSFQSGAKHMCKLAVNRNLCGVFTGDVRRRLPGSSFMSVLLLVNL